MNIASCDFVVFILSTAFLYVMNADFPDLYSEENFSTERDNRSISID
jgi:hypothetical protein